MVSENIANGNNYDESCENYALSNGRIDSRTQSRASSEKSCASLKYRVGVGGVVCEYVDTLPHTRTRSLLCFLSRDGGGSLFRHSLFLNGTIPNPLRLTLHLLTVGVTKTGNKN